MPPIEKLDPNLSPQFVKNALEDRRIENLDEETAALFNASIVAKPMNTPQSGKIAKELNTEMHYHWIRDRNGNNPYHDRVEALRYEGWEFATTKDVEMAVKSTVHGEAEIRNGDLVLMKWPKEKWLALRKSQQMEAIGQFSPRRVPDADNIMRSASLVSDETVMQDFANRRNAGNTSVVRQQKGA
jgi:hypothetical protein